MPRGEDHDPRITYKDLVDGLAAWRKLQAWDPEGPLEVFTLSDDVFSREHFHISIIRDR
jgi:hypothetical protein